MTDQQAANEQNIPFLESADGEEERGALEGNAQALLYLLRLFTLSQRRANVDFGAFVGFVKANSQRFLLKFPQLEEFARHTEAMVRTYLKVLAEHGVCSLEGSAEAIRSVQFPQFYTELVHKAYRELAEHPDSPFPNEDRLGVELPPALVTDVNIKTEFVSLLVEMRSERAAILRLAFPELIQPLVVTSDLVEKRLLELAVVKLRQFLALRNNAGYVTHRLNTVLRGHEHALRDIVNAIMAKPGRAVGTLLEPSDFSFRFWAHFANLVLQEYRERTDKLPEEQAYCQAAYLVGLYNVHYRGRQQRVSERESLVKKFEVQFRRYPYAYTLKDLYALRDDKGIPLVRKNTKDVFTEFLDSRTKRDELKGLPEIVRLRTLDGKEYYVRRELVIPVFVKMLHEKSEELQNAYMEEWVQLLKDNRRVPAMNEDTEFERDLDLTVRNRYPLLYALLNHNLLFLAKETTNLDYDMGKTMERVLDPRLGTLKPLPEVLGLARRDILDSAKLRVPLLQRLSLFKNLYYWLQRMLRNVRKALQESAGRAGAAELHPEAGAEAEPSPGAAGGEEPAAEAAGRRGRKGGDAAVPGRKTRRAPFSSGLDSEYPREGSTTLRPTSASELAAYRKAVEKLKVELVGKDKSVAESLKELRERWNPLYDPQARMELVEDVNAMIRDYFRKLKRTFRVSPPTAARIRDLAAKLSENKSFERIKRKDVFARYVEVYMLDLLGER
ncbi:MAG: hypothetical protein JW820_07590 [Spirochaetales bacterium]|nr:hypothetical protein [Spirochaetales bacterium]